LVSLGLGVFRDGGEKPDWNWVGIETGNRGFSAVLGIERTPARAPFEVRVNRR